MSKVNLELISKLRDATGAPVVRVKKVLDEVEGDEKKALNILSKEGFEKAAKRSERTTGQGVISTYLHHSKKIATMVEILCETDFVARNEMFESLGHNLAMQLAFSTPATIEEFSQEVFIKDPSKKVEDLVKEVIAKTGENVRIGRFYRLQIGA